MGWQSGTMSGVRLAARMPASRAAASTSPFSDSPRRRMPASPATWRPAARHGHALGAGLVPDVNHPHGAAPGAVQWMPCSPSQRSASMAAAHPDPAAVTAWR